MPVLHSTAGKTSLMGMVTGLTSPTSGACHIYSGASNSSGSSNGSSSSHSRGSSPSYCQGEALGYCPQAAVILPELTIRENLEAVAAIKGLPRPAWTQAVAAAAGALGLPLYAAATSKGSSGMNLLVEDEVDDMGAVGGVRQAQSVHVLPAGQLSGGNKRKLQVSMGRAGRPPCMCSWACWAQTCTGTSINVSVPYIRDKYTRIGFDLRCDTFTLHILCCVCCAPGGHGPAGLPCCAGAGRAVLWL